MSGIKKNFAYNSFLTVSNYVINLILFPYCARVLGVERFGTTNFVQNVVEYFVFIAMMGITHIGVREIAKCNNPDERNLCYSSLLVLNLLYSIISLSVFLPLIFIIERFISLQTLFILGAFHILFSVFKVEWLFRGLEDFRYITIRNIVIKVIYIISVFLFVRSSDDYILFYALTVLVTLVNAVINYMYSRNVVKFSIKGITPFKYLKSSLSLGFYSILTSMYTTFNVIYLGLTWDDFQVGFYTTAIKLYTVIVGFYSAFTGVMMPRLSSILSNHDENEYHHLIEKSLTLLYTVTIPCVLILIVLSPEIVTLLAGSEYEPSILMSRIVIPVLFLVGLGQILSFQVLIPMGMDKSTLQASLVGACVGIGFNLWLTTGYGAIGTCITVFLTELCVTGFYLYIALKKRVFEVNINILFRHLAAGLPYGGICYFFHLIFSGDIILVPLVSAFVCLLWFLYSQTKLLRNELVTNAIRNFSHNNI